MQGNRSAAPHPHQSGLPRVPIVCGPKPPCCPALSHCRSHRNGAMLLLQPLRAAHRGVPLLLVVTALMAGVPLVVRAGTAAQRQGTTAALSQLGALERTVAHSAAHTPIAPGERYHFDYPRLLADLARVRAPIPDHPTPSPPPPPPPPRRASATTSPTRGSWPTWRACAPGSRTTSRLHVPSRAIPPNWPATTAPGGLRRPHRRPPGGTSHERRPALRISGQQRHPARSNGGRPRRHRLRRAARVGRLGHPNGLRGVVGKPPQPAPVPRRLHPLRRDVPRADFFPPLLT